MRKRIISFFLAVAMVMTLFGGFSLSVHAVDDITMEYIPGIGIDFTVTGIPASVVVDGATVPVTSFQVEVHRAPYNPAVMPIRARTVDRTAANVTGTILTGPLNVGTGTHVLVVRLPGGQPPVQRPVPPVITNHTVTFRLNGGSLVSGTLVQTVADGGAATPPTVYRDGHNFMGWVSDPPGHSYGNITQDVAFDAQWQIRPPVGHQFDITFDPRGGTVTPLPAVRRTELSGILLSWPSASRAGYIFQGWTHTPGGTDLVNFALPFTRNTTVYAAWTPVVSLRYPPVIGVERQPGAAHTRPDRRVGDDGEEIIEPPRGDGWVCLCFRRPPFSNRVASEWFDDVAAGQWYHSHVSVALSNDAFRGTAPRTFEPQTTMSRAMFAQVLFNLVSCCNDIGLYWNRPSPFTDVTQDDWFFPVINWAYANDLISGVGGGRFAPTDPVTREQMAALLNRFATAENITFPTGASPAFTDQATISAWAVADVQTIQGAGIVGGYPDGSFRPQGNATRAEVATIFAGFLNMVQAQYAGQ